MAHHVGAVAGMIGAEWLTVPVAIIAATPATIAAVASWRSARGVHRAVNSRPDQAPTISEDVSVTRYAVVALRDDVAVLKTRLDEHMRDHEPTRRRRR
jgi:hypothetical protein